MATKLFILALLFSHIYFAQTRLDSTKIKNQQLIEQLKNRINTIDNIGNGENSYQTKIDVLKAKIIKQNDSIVKLLNTINELKKHETASPSNTQNIDSTFLKNKTNSDNVYNISNSITNYEATKADELFKNYISACNCNVLFYKPYEVEINFNVYNMMNDIIKNYNAKTNKKIIIVGHADNSGNEQTNIDLSKKRAENFKTFLINAAPEIKKENIIIEWHGSSMPIKNLPENEKNLNRRVEIKYNN